MYQGVSRNWLEFSNHVYPAPLSLTMFFTALLAGRRAGKRRPSSLIRAGFALLGLGVLALIPIVPRVARLVFQAVHSLDIGEAYRLAAVRVLAADLGSMFHAAVQVAAPVIGALVVAGCALWGPGSQASAQDYPNRPVKIIIAFSPAGGGLTRPAASA